MNPFDVHGPQYLVIYLGTLVGGIIVSLVVRELMRMGGISGSSQKVEYHPYEIAYLNGGDEHVLLTAISKLLHLQAIGLDNDRGVVRIRIDKDPLVLLEQHYNNEGYDQSNKEIEKAARDFEEALCKSVEGREWKDVYALRDKFPKHIAKFRERLTQQNYVVSPSVASMIKIIMLVCVLVAPLGLGIPRIIEAFHTHRPVVFLGLLVAISFLVALATMKVKTVRTHGGEKKYIELKEKNWGLYESSGASETESIMSSKDLLLGFSVFGLAMPGPLSEASNMLYHSQAYMSDPHGAWMSCNAGKCSDYGGWSSCGGGCGGCGGGCGGCGGCGG